MRGRKAGSNGGDQMKGYTKEDIFRIVEEKDVRFIKLQFTDMYGMPKNVNLPVGQLRRALSGRCVFDGASIEGFIRKDEEDMLLQPDLNTFQIFPVRGRDGQTARLICDINDAEGRPFGGDPRYILKRVTAEAERQGYFFKIKPELEFFLFNCDESGNPTTKSSEAASYFDMMPLDFGESLRNEMAVTLEEMGYPIASTHHENSDGQHEIDFEAQPGLFCADAIETAKILIRIIARRAGMHATFMPKPTAGISGSGMHISISLENKEGKNLFYDSKEMYGLSDLAYAFMSGVIRHIAGMTLILNPLVNSYKRFVPGYDAPVDISWSAGTNRGSLLRIPSRHCEQGKIELRSPDPSCNPYLAFALVFAAGLEGLAEGENKLRNEGLSLGSLPANLGQAIEAYRRDSFIRDVLGDTIYDKLMEAKTEEWNQYQTQVTPWEVQTYLYKY